MKIGIVGAMPQEIDLLAADLVNDRVESIGQRQYYSGALYGKETVLVFSRWGKVAAASTVTTLIDRFKTDLVIFTGVSGAASKDLEIGDIVIADELIQHDMDASTLPMFKKFEVPLLGVSEFRVQKSHVDLAKKAAETYIQNDLFREIGCDMIQECKIGKPKVVVGTIASGDQFITDSQRISGLIRDVRNLKCVEMEGAAIAQVCYENGVPFIGCRSISDKADHSSVIDFPKFVEQVARFFSRGIVKNILGEL